LIQPHAGCSAANRRKYAERRLSVCQFIANFVRFLLIVRSNIGAGITYEGTTMCIGSYISAETPSGHFHALRALTIEGIMEIQPET
jgi:hypothetical protein